MSLAIDRATGRFSQAFLEMVKASEEGAEFSQRQAFSLEGILAGAKRLDEHRGLYRSLSGEGSNHDASNNAEDILRTAIESATGMDLNSLTGVSLKDSVSVVKHILKGLNDLDDRDSGNLDAVRSRLAIAHTIVKLTSASIEKSLENQGGATERVDRVNRYSAQRKCHVALLNLAFESTELVADTDGSDILDLRAKIISGLQFPESVSPSWKGMKGESLSSPSGNGELELTRNSYRLNDSKWVLDMLWSPDLSRYDENQSVPVGYGFIDIKGAMKPGSDEGILYRKMLGETHCEVIESLLLRTLRNAVHFAQKDRLNLSISPTGRDAQTAFDYWLRDSFKKNLRATISGLVNATGDESYREHSSNKKVADDLGAKVFDRLSQEPHLLMANDARRLIGHLSVPLAIAARRGDERGVDALRSVWKEMVEISRICEERLAESDPVSTLRNPLATAHKKACLELISLTGAILRPGRYQETQDRMRGSHNNGLENYAIDPSMHDIRVLGSRHTDPLPEDHEGLNVLMAEMMNDVHHIFNDPGMDVALNSHFPDEITKSIGHGRAGLQWLKRSTTDILDKAVSTQEIGTDGYRVEAGRLSGYLDKDFYAKTIDANLRLDFKPYFDDLNLSSVDFSDETRMDMLNNSIINTTLSPPAAIDYEENLNHLAEVAKTALLAQAETGVIGGKPDLITAEWLQLDKVKMAEVLVHEHTTEKLELSALIEDLDRLKLSFDTALSQSDDTSAADYILKEKNEIVQRLLGYVDAKGEGGIENVSVWLRAKGRLLDDEQKVALVQKLHETLTPTLNQTLGIVEDLGLEQDSKAYLMLSEKALLGFYGEIEEEFGDRFNFDVSNLNGKAGDNRESFDEIAEPKEPNIDGVAEPNIFDGLPVLASKIGLGNSYNRVVSVEFSQSPIKRIWRDKEGYLKEALANSSLRNGHWQRAAFIYSGLSSLPDFTVEPGEYLKPDFELMRSPKELSNSCDGTGFALVSEFKQLANTGVIDSQFSLSATTTISKRFQAESFFNGIRVTLPDLSRSEAYRIERASMISASLIGSVLSMFESRDSLMYSGVRSKSFHGTPIGSEEFVGIITSTEITEDQAALFEKEMASRLLIAESLLSDIKSNDTPFMRALVSGALLKHSSAWGVETCALPHPNEIQSEHLAGYKSRIIRLREIMGEVAEQLIEPSAAVDDHPQSQALKNACSSAANLVRASISNPLLSRCYSRSAPFVSGDELSKLNRVEFQSPSVNDFHSALSDDALNASWCHSKGGSLIDSMVAQGYDREMLESAKSVKHLCKHLIGTAEKNEVALLEGLLAGHARTLRGSHQFLSDQASNPLQCFINTINGAKALTMKVKGGSKSGARLIENRQEAVLRIKSLNETLACTGYLESRAEEFDNDSKFTIYSTLEHTIGACGGIETGVIYRNLAGLLGNDLRALQFSTIRRQSAIFNMVKSLDDEDLTPKEILVMMAIKIRNAKGDPNSEATVKESLDTLLASIDGAKSEALGIVKEKWDLMPNAFKEKFDYKGALNIRPFGDHERYIDALTIPRSDLKKTIQDSIEADGNILMDAISEDAELAVNLKDLSMLTRSITQANESFTGTLTNALRQSLQDLKISRLERNSGFESVANLKEPFVVSDLLGEDYPEALSTGEVAPGELIGRFITDVGEQRAVASHFRNCVGGTSYTDALKSGGSVLIHMKPSAERLQYLADEGMKRGKWSADDRLPAERGYLVYAALDSMQIKEINTFKNGGTNNDMSSMDLIAIEEWCNKFRDTREHRIAVVSGALTLDNLMAAKIMGSSGSHEVEDVEAGDEGGKLDFKRAIEFSGVDGDSLIDVNDLPSIYRNKTDFNADSIGEDKIQRVNYGALLFMEIDRKLLNLRAAQDEGLDSVDVFLDSIKNGPNLLGREISQYVLPNKIKFTLCSFMYQSLKSAGLSKEKLDEFAQAANSLAKNSFVSKGNEKFFKALIGSGIGPSNMEEGAIWDRAFSDGLEKTLRLSNFVGSYGIGARDWLDAPLTVKASLSGRDDLGADALLSGSFGVDSPEMAEWLAFIDRELPGNVEEFIDGVYKGRINLKTRHLNADTLETFNPSASANSGIVLHPGSKVEDLQWRINKFIRKNSDVLSKYDPITSLAQISNDIDPLESSLLSGLLKSGQVNALDSDQSSRVLLNGAVIAANELSHRFTVSPADDMPNAKVFDHKAMSIFADHVTETHGGVAFSTLRYGREDIEGMALKTRDGISGLSAKTAKAKLGSLAYMALTASLAATEGEYIEQGRKTSALLGLFMVEEMDTVSFTIISPDEEQAIGRMIRATQGAAELLSKIRLSENDIELNSPDISLGSGPTLSAAKMAAELAEKRSFSKWRNGPGDLQKAVIVERDLARSGLITVPSKACESIIHNESDVEALESIAVRQEALLTAVRQHGADSLQASNLKSTEIGAAFNDSLFQLSTIKNQLFDQEAMINQVLSNSAVSSAIIYQMIKSEYPGASDGKRLSIGRETMPSDVIQKIAPEARIGELTTQLSGLIISNTATSDLRKKEVDVESLWGSLRTLDGSAITSLNVLSLRELSALDDFLSDSDTANTAQNWSSANQEILRCHVASIVETTVTELRDKYQMPVLGFNTGDILSGNDDYIFIHMSPGSAEKMSALVREKLSQIQINGSQTEIHGMLAVIQEHTEIDNFALISGEAFGFRRSHVDEPLQGRDLAAMTLGVDAARVSDAELKRRMSESGLSPKILDRSRTPESVGSLDNEKAFDRQVDSLNKSKRMAR